MPPGNTIHAAQAWYCTLMEFSGHLLWRGVAHDAYHHVAWAIALPEERLYLAAPQALHVHLIPNDGPPVVVGNGCAQERLLEAPHGRVVYSGAALLRHHPLFGVELPEDWRLRPEAKNCVEDTRRSGICYEMKSLQRRCCNEWAGGPVETGSRVQHMLQLHDLDMWCPAVRLQHSLTLHQAAFSGTRQHST